MRMTVDFPAPFSPTIACIVPLWTVMDTSLFAMTDPKVLVMFLSSSMWLVVRADTYLRLRIADFGFGLGVTINLQSEIRNPQWGCPVATAPGSACAATSRYQLAADTGR